jgi:hypothetical protein
MLLLQCLTQITEIYATHATQDDVDVIQQPIFINTISHTDNRNIGDSRDSR